MRTNRYLLIDDCIILMLMGVEPAELAVLAREARSRADYYTYADSLYRFCRS